jgi:hypothetical protein
MATKMLVCPECEAAVAPGRFACPSCGTLLASVASVPRTLGWADELAPPVLTARGPVEASAEPQQVADEIAADETTDTHAGRVTIGPGWAHGPLERAPGEAAGDLVDEDAPLAADTLSPDAQHDHDTDWPDAAASGGALPATIDEPVGESTDLETMSTAEPELEPAPEPVLDAVAPPTATIDDEDADQGIDAGSAEPAEPAEPATEPVAAPPVAEVAAEAMTPNGTAEPSWPETRSWPPLGAERQPSPAPEAVKPRAGAYLPPSAFLTSVDEVGTSAPADAPVTPSATPVPSANASVTEPQEGRFAGLVPTLSPAAPARAVVVGAAMAGLGFLLPWAPVVIGSGRIGGYFEQWGLAGPAHPLLVLVLIALGALASQVERLPGWARPGLPAVILAALLFGVAWPYLFGGFQPSIGLYLTVAGAVVIGVGGLLDMWAGRHAGGSRAV